MVLSNAWKHAKEASIFMSAETGDISSNDQKQNKKTQYIYLP